LGKSPSFLQRERFFHGCFDLPIDLFVISGPALEDPPIPADQDRCREPPDPVSVMHFLLGIQHYLITYAFLANVFRNMLRERVHADADHFKPPGPELLMELLELRDGLMTGDAVRRPEIQQNDLPAKIRQPDSSTGKIRQGEIRRGRGAGRFTAARAGKERAREYRREDPPQRALS